MEFMEELDYLNKRGFKLSGEAEKDFFNKYFRIGKNKIEILEDNKTVITRILKNDKFKYIKNNKSIFLNFKQAIEEAKKQNYLIITEGEFDCLTAINLSFKSVVSLSGIGNIKKLFEGNEGEPSSGLIYNLLEVNKIFILDLTDNDEAGKKASQEIKAFCKNTDNLKYVNIKKNILEFYKIKDLNEFITEFNNKKQLKNLLKNEIKKALEGATEEAEATTEEIKKVVDNLATTKEGETVKEYSNNFNNLNNFNNNNNNNNNITIKKTCQTITEETETTTTEEDEGITKNFNVKITKQLKQKNGINSITFLFNDKIEATTTAEAVTTEKEFLKFVKNVNIKFFFLANTKKNFLLFINRIAEATTTAEELKQVGFLTAKNKKYFYDGNIKINNIGIAEATSKQATEETKKLINLCDLSELAESYKNNLFLNDNKFFEMFETIKKNLFEFNNNKNIALFWATVGNCFLKHIYRDLNFKIPISFICGEAGSGKSATADNFFNKILLTNEIIEDINTTTIFSIINKLSSSNFSTVIINEFKGGEGKAEKLEEVIKAIYDGTTFTRGQQNLLLKHYNFTNNIILIGEEEAKDKATAERFLFINLTKKESQKHKKEFKEIARQANQKKLSFVGFKLLIEATNTTSKEITEIYEGLSDVDNICDIIITYVILGIKLHPISICT